MLKCKAVFEVFRNAGVTFFDGDPDLGRPICTPIEKKRAFMDFIGS